MRTFMDIIREGEEPRISAEVHTQHGSAVIHDFYVPRSLRGQGVARRFYEQWEADLPSEIECVRLFAADYEGEGNSDGFWEAMGFSYRYDGEDLSYEASHEMWKGVNGHPTPPTVNVDDEDEDD